MSEIVEILKITLLYVSFPVFVGACVFMGRKLQKLDDLDSLVREKIEPRLDGIETNMILLESSLKHISKTTDLLLELMLGREKELKYPVQR